MIRLGEFSTVLHRNICCGYSLEVPCWVLIRNVSPRKFSNEPSKHTISMCYFVGVVGGVQFTTTRLYYISTIRSAKNT